MYKPNELKQDVKGVYKRHPKLKTYIKSLKDPVSINVDINNLKKYLSEGPWEYKSEYAPNETFTYSWSSMARDLNLYAIKLKIDSFKSCFSGDNTWTKDFKESIEYEYWALKLDLKFHDMAFKEFNEGQRVKLSMLFLRDAGVTLGSCIALGWLDYADELMTGINNNLKNTCFSDAYDRSSRRRTQHFILRLLSHYNGTDEIQKELDIKCAYDVPLFNRLVENWATEDTKYLSELLIQAADRHTHQCRQDSWNNNRFYDFQNWDLEYYYPFEILAIERLRKLKGLTTPRIEHRILDTPLGQLLEYTPPEKPKFLMGLLDRASKEFPSIKS
ncbi:hypothetical protein L1077_26400 [Pseudoalteromonas luteoviolacea]|uniref:hypothetical protein n=1 Tax=Pseudoalteromonas luteoviolacea TaxID=43657 RepID=UPI001F461D42|nr:hypothetical protein [Pseudoalteromonas luteoviolacea]MCF6442959.1 hypothetical protein [Pseudoalteromonas luteoviolacea]